MVIFNSYVSLPEGNKKIAPTHHCTDPKFPTSDSKVVEVIHLGIGAKM